MESKEKSVSIESVSSIDSEGMVSSNHSVQRKNINMRFIIQNKDNRVSLTIKCIPNGTAFVTP